MKNDIYTAGLFDGEGTVTLTKRGKFRHPTVSVSSTTYKLLEFLLSSYGGSISKHKTYQKHHKPSWSWKLDYKRAVSFLTRIQPYILEPEKLYRVNLILSEYDLITPCNGKYTEDLTQKKLDFESRFFHPSGP